VLFGPRDVQGIEAEIHGERGRPAFETVRDACGILAGRQAIKRADLKALSVRAMALEI